MLANPMTYDVTSPTSPPNYPTHAISNPNTPTNPSHQGSGFTRGAERLSLKSKSKNQSFFKIFSRSSSGGGAQVIPKDEEYVADASSGSDHEDPFSVSPALIVPIRNYNNEMIPSIMVTVQWEAFPMPCFQCVGLNCHLMTI